MGKWRMRDNEKNVTEQLNTFFFFFFFFFLKEGVSLYILLSNYIRLQAKQ